MGIPRIGRYEILGELGRGAMGVVYKGRDTAIDRIVAVKTIKLDKQEAPLGTTGSVDRLYQEARVAGRLSHPNIATIFDVGEEKGIHYIVMEYIRGVPLEKIIREKKTLPVIEKIKIIILIATALDYAHQRGVVHRDIKPANIMLLQKFQIKIMDFGIAGVVTKKKDSFDQGENICGTPFYMSPEQISGNSLDRQTDVFSLGVLSYELLTGENPFQADNFPELIDKIVSKSPAPLQQVDPQIHPKVDDAVARALKKSKEERYLSAAEFADDLEIFLNQQEMTKTQDVPRARGYDKENLIQSLKKHYAFFSNFTDNELRQIFKISKKMVCHTGEVICEENTIGKTMYIIITGKIVITKRFRENEETVLNRLKAGDCFGEMSIMDASPRFATVKAEAECLLMEINEVILRSSEPKLCLKLYKNLASVLSEKLKKSDTKAHMLERKLQEIKN